MQICACCLSRGTCSPPSQLSWQFSGHSNHSISVTTESVRVVRTLLRCEFLILFIPVTLPDELKVLERIETLDISYVRA